MLQTWKMNHEGEGTQDSAGTIAPFRISIHTKSHRLSYKKTTKRPNAPG